MEKKIKPSSKTKEGARVVKKRAVKAKAQTGAKKQPEAKIYGIKDIARNCFVYVGSTSKTIQKRFSEHIYQIKNSTHHNPALSALILEKGFGNFAVELIEEVEISKRDEREYFWIGFYNQNENKLLNIQLSADSFYNRIATIGDFEQIPHGVQIVDERFSAFELLDNKFKCAEWIVRCDDNKIYKIVVQDFEKFKIVEHQCRKIPLRRLSLKFDQFELELKLKPFIKNPLWLEAWKEVFYAQSL